MRCGTPNTRLALSSLNVCLLLSADFSMRFLFFLAPSLCSLVTPALKRFSSEPGIMYPFGGNVPLMMCESLALAAAFRWHFVWNCFVFFSPISLATLCKKLWDHPKRSIIASFLVL